MNGAVREVTEITTLAPLIIICKVTGWRFTKQTNKNASVVPVQVKRCNAGTSHYTVQLCQSLVTDSCVLYAIKFPR